MQEAGMDDEKKRREDLASRHPGIQDHRLDVLRWSPSCPKLGMATMLWDLTYS